MRISDWSSDVCASDLPSTRRRGRRARARQAARPRGGRPRAASARPRRSSPSTPSAKNRSRRRLAALRAALAHGGGVPLLGLLLAGRLAEAAGDGGRSEEHTSELQSLMRISYAVFCLKKTQKMIHKNSLN